MRALNQSEGHDRLLTADDFAERWQVSRSQVYALALAGKIPAVLIGRYYRFRLDALLEWERGGGSASAVAGRNRRI